MARRIGVEVDDVEGHLLRWEDLTGQEVTIRMEDGTEVQGHLKYPEEARGDDTEGHGWLKGGRIDLEVADTQAHLLTVANERGAPVYVRFPDGDEVKGHGVVVRVEDTTGDETEGHWVKIRGEDATSEDTEGHKMRAREDTTGDDVEGHRIVTPPQSDIP
jgi:hypothetical protein